MLQNPVLAGRAFELVLIKDLLGSNSLENTSAFGVVKDSTKREGFCFERMDDRNSEFEAVKST